MKPLPFLFFILCLANFIQAQSTWPDISKHQGLNLVSEADNITVFTSENAQVDDHTLNLLWDAKRYFDQVFGMDFPVSILFVSNSEWNDYAYFPPPGMPQAWAGNIFLGNEKSIVAIQAEQQLQNLPAEQLKELQSHFGDPLNMDLFYRNNVAVHELGHLYHFFEASKPQKRWLQELFATYAARNFLVKSHPKMAKATAAYAEVGSEAHFPFIKHTSLEKFEELYLPGLGAQNYEWFQFQLFKKAVKLQEKFGEKGLIELRVFLIQTDLTETEKMDYAQLQNQLEEQLGIDMAELLLSWGY
ncbi:hypothetical protein [Algoriphagus hitonicola]|uniref:DUF1570 domain-containing protein n=1 Tax=Algoriphagus hitonicola TaxID=435880 RepID=A0A1I2QG70_9BACT|nr:hypothetical protein [Algoriphagus hitonicola]SFG25227.1 hypothetical protein SAMN04487988_102187 [Algoriphagus hitonicola]